MLDHTHKPYSTQIAFVEPFTVPKGELRGIDVVDLENPPPSEGVDLPCAAAIDFLADIYEAMGKRGLDKAVEVRITSSLV